MKVTKSTLKKIIKEEISKILQEQAKTFTIHEDDLSYGPVKLDVQFLGFDTPYDMTEATFKVSFDGDAAKDLEISAGFDTEDLATNFVNALVDIDDHFWFASDDDEDDTKILTAKAKQIFDQLGINPQDESEERTGYRARDTGEGF